MRPNLIENADVWFWPHVQVGDPDECWLWGRPLHHTGYGVVKMSGKQMKVHRVAYLLTHGQPDNDVLHRCGSRPCCNPNHLYDGTDLQNAADRERHGKTSRLGGERGSQTKLTREQVRLITADERSAALIATEYGIHKRHVYRLKSGERWSTQDRSTASAVQPEDQDGQRRLRAVPRR